MVSSDRNSVIETLNTALSKYEEPVEEIRRVVVNIGDVREVFEASDNVESIFAKLEDLDKKRTHGRRHISSY